MRNESADDPVPRAGNHFVDVKEFNIGRDPSTRSPALAGGSCSGFRPRGVLEDATGLLVGLHHHGDARVVRPLKRLAPDDRRVIVTIGLHVGAPVVRRWIGRNYDSRGCGVKVRLGTC